MKREGARAAAQAPPLHACGAILFQPKGSEKIYLLASSTLIQNNIIIGALHPFNHIGTGTYFFTLAPNIDTSNRASLGDLYKVKYMRRFKGQDVAVCLLDSPITSVTPASVLTSQEHKSRQSLRYAAFNGIYAGYGKDNSFVGTQEISTKDFADCYYGRKPFSAEAIYERTLRQLQIMNFAVSPAAFANIPDAALACSDIPDAASAYSDIPDATSAFPAPSHPADSHVVVSLTNEMMGLEECKKGILLPFQEILEQVCL